MLNKIKSKLYNYLRYKPWFIKLTCKSVNFKETKNIRTVFPKSAVNYENIINKFSINEIKMVAIVSCFDKKCSVSESLLYYLTKLSEIVDSIIVVFDNPIFSKEIEKLSRIKKIIYVKCKRHRKYDFGSYQIGINFLKSIMILDKIDNLYLCNDSCYGPLYNIRNIVKKMNTKNIDFWGFVENSDFSKHIQSWFICLKKQVLLNNKALLFFKKIKKHRYVWDVILKYEIGFTNYLLRLGYSYDTFIPKGTSPNNLNIIGKPLLNNIMVYPMELINTFSFPFIKKKCFSEYIKFNDESNQILKLLKKKNLKLYKLIYNDLDMGRTIRYLKAKKY